MATTDDHTDQEAAIRNVVDAWRADHPGNSALSVANR